MANIWRAYRQTFQQRVDLSPHREIIQQPELSLAHVHQVVAATLLMLMAA